MSTNLRKKCALFRCICIKVCFDKSLVADSFAGSVSQLRRLLLHALYILGLGVLKNGWMDG